MSNDATTAASEPGPDERATAGFPAAPPREVSHGPGTMIGAYKVLELLGEGGFGVVYLAEQSQPVRRRVALKIIKPGMDSRAIVARFEAERQALALMSHPNIAKVLDAGTTPLDLPGGGRPYFAMEHIKGTPITDYCDTHRLSVEQRLKLFMVVCEAVQHAHMKGIIHRDLKPSNILVTIAEGAEPRPVVIDFGVAKALAGRLGDQTIYTERGMLIGTPEYMSPEQAEMSEADIDTRSDVYSLGVLLYELLTGAVPFDAGSLRAAGIAAIQKMIREAEPPRPSTRLSTMGEANTAIAAARRSAVGELSTQLRRELEWIPLKALRKDRSERYRSASELADDIANYLAQKPLIAGPESAAYRTKKLIRRNKGAVSAVSVIAATLVAATSVSVWFGLSEARQRAEAVRQTGIAEASAAQAKKQEVEAKKQQDIAEAVAKFQTDMLAAVDPANVPKDPVTGEQFKDKITVLQAVQAAVKQLDEGSLKDQPLVEASVRDTIGTTLQGLARYDEAEPNLRKALAIRRAALPAGDMNIGNSLNSIAMLLLYQNKLIEAEPLFREELAIYRAALPAGHRKIATGLDNLAHLLLIQNRLAEAEPLIREALEIRRVAFPAGNPAIAVSLNNLAQLLVRRNNLPEAESLNREALKIRRAILPAGHPDIAISLNNLAELLVRRNNLPEAESLNREALEIRRATLPAGHPDIAMSLNNLAELLRTQNMLVEAEPLYREALEISRKVFPAGHPRIATGVNNLAVLLQAQNKYAEAEPLCREALVMRRKALPAGHPDIAAGLNNLARAQHALGQTAEARAGWDEAIAILRKDSPDGSPNLARVLWRSGSARLENKDGAGGPAAALPELEEAVAMGEKVMPADHPYLKEYRDTLAKCKAALGQ